MTVDGFLFRNEFECLEVRLEELAPHVDRFVVVEATHTFQGNWKPLWFDQQKDRFDRFPITHVVVEDLLDVDGPWERETRQRDAIVRGLDDVDDDDIVMVSDADEIPAAEVVARLDEPLSEHPQAGFTQKLCFYYVDNVCHTRDWYGTQAIRAGALRARGAQDVRNNRNDGVDVVGGWHFCSLGDAEWLREKLRSFAHDELNTPEYTDLEFLQRAIESGQEMTGRQDILFRHEPDMPLPGCLTRERFPHLFTPVPVPA